MDHDLCTKAERTGQLIGSNFTQIVRQDCNVDNIKRKTVRIEPPNGGYRGRHESMARGWTMFVRVLQASIAT
jgi:hypothetical protein